MPKPKYCKLPTSVTVTGRSSSITNAFFNAIIPVVAPTPEEELECLKILEMNPTDIRCAYCGDKATEWDHFRAIIEGQRPTGYITEIANLVPACGKCNQSKGKAPWKQWMLSSAELSPLSRGIPDLHTRIRRLEAYELWKTPTRINFEKVVGEDLWSKHIQNWKSVLELLQRSQKLAQTIRKRVIESQRSHD